MSYTHQDWTPVVFSKKNETVVKQSLKAVSQLDTKQNRELKDNPEGFTSKMFEKEYIQDAIKKRTEKGWTQKQLANQMNVDASIIQRFEQGKHVYDSSLKSKLNRILGITSK